MLKNKQEDDGPSLIFATSSREPLRYALMKNPNSGVLMLNLPIAWGTINIYGFSGLKAVALCNISSTL